MTDPDYRALCAELLDALCNYETAAIDATLADRARNALAQPEPVAPTDEELLATQDQAVASFPPLHPEAAPLSAVEYAMELEIRKARAILARFAQPTLTPIPVSDRPWERDGFCDAEGRCWLFGKIEGGWRLISANNSGVPKLSYCFSHCLPADALPLPAAPGEVE